MRTTDPGRMSVADRLAELGEILAAGLQRLAASRIKQIESSRHRADQLDAGADQMAPCGHPTEATA